VKPLFVILGAAAIGGVAFLAYRRRQEQSSSGTASTCEKLCVEAARAKGAVGDLSTLCKQSCSVGETLVKRLGGALSDVFGGETPPFCSTCCPAGSSPTFTDRPFGEQTSVHLRDHRTLDGTSSGESVWGAVCVDDVSGTIIGTLTDRFNPYTIGTTTPPASVGVYSPTGATAVGANPIASTPPTTDAPLVWVGDHWERASATATAPTTTTTTLATALASRAVESTTK
jgi:hypothetical protein